jgi:hypothetical protein
MREKCFHVQPKCSRSALQAGIVAELLSKDSIKVWSFEGNERVLCGTNAAELRWL